MKPLLQQNDAMEVLTYGKESSFTPESINSLGIITEPGSSLVLAVADEVPLFLGVKGKFLFGAKVSQEAALDESVLVKAKFAIEDAKVSPEEVKVILGPSLGFAHTPTSRETILDLIERGYRVAAKRTEGQDYLDLGVLVYAELRRLGIKPENISISDYDTFESNNLLYSKSVKDTGLNYVVGTLR